MRLPNQYKWVILVASTLVNSLTWGLLYSVGVLFYNWVEYFEESRALVAVACALPPGVGGIFGPLFGFFIEKFGTRKMGIFGGLLMTTSHIASAYASNVYYLCVVYGLVSGLGAGFANLSASYALNNYFVKKRAMAEGIMTGGVSAGTFFFAFLQQYFIDKYGWRSTMMLMGAITSHLIVLSLLLVTPSYVEKISIIKRNQSQQIDPLDDPIEITASLNGFDVETKCLKKEKHTKGSFMRRSLLLWKKPVFLLILICDFVGWLATFVPYVHLSERARLEGIDSQTAAWMSSAIGIAGIPGRSLLPSLASYTNIHPFAAYGIVHIFIGVVTAASPLFSTKLGLFIYAILFGLMSCDYPFIKASISKLMHKEWFGIAFSWLLLFEGIGVVLGPSVAGWIYDATQSYDRSFYIAGGLFLFSGILAIVYFQISVRKKKVPTSLSSQGLVSSAES